MSTVLVQPKIEITQEQIEYIKRKNNATDEEISLYLRDCQRRGVHPADNLIHFSRRDGKYMPITSIDFMRMRASDSGEYAGSDDAVYEDSPPPSKFPLKASITVWRITHGQRCPFGATARWSEYAPDLSGKGSFMWKKMPYTMLGKCAEALALRKAFPGQLQGLYAREEMDQSPNEEKMAPSDARAYADRVVEEARKVLPLPPEEPPLTKALRQSVEREAPKDYQEDDQGFASFTLTRVETKSGKNGEYRKLYWNGGSAQCFKAEQFEEIDSLTVGHRVAIQGVRHKGEYTNFDAIVGSLPPEEIGPSYPAVVAKELAEAHVMPEGEITDLDVPF